MDDQGGPLRAPIQYLQHAIDTPTTGGSRNSAVRGQAGVRADCRSRCRTGQGVGELSQPHAEMRGQRLLVRVCRGTAEDWLRSPQGTLEEDFVPADRHPVELLGLYWKPQKDDNYVAYATAPDPTRAADSRRYRGGDRHRSRSRPLVAGHDRARPAYGRVR